MNAPAIPNARAGFRGYDGNTPMVPEALVRDVDLLCLDAGNTVIFLDHARMAALVNTTGGQVSADALLRAEGPAKLALELGTMEDVAWTSDASPGARSWGRYLATVCANAGVPRARLATILDRLWEDHMRWNLFSLVPEGLGDALDALRATGARVAIVSNSEGRLETLFEALDVLRHFDTVVDSGNVGVEKPDPRIFEIALERCGAVRERTVMLGDIFATDIVGARCAGIRSALVDPHGHLAGRHEDVARVASAAEVARAIGDERNRKGVG